MSTTMFGVAVPALPLDDGEGEPGATLSTGPLGATPVGATPVGPGSVDSRPRGSLEATGSDEAAALDAAPLVTGGPAVCTPDGAALSPLDVLGGGLVGCGVAPGAPQPARAIAPISAAPTNRPRRAAATARV